MNAHAFDPRSGSLIERALFNHRAVVVLLCALVTLLLGWQATRLQLNASFEKTIPTSHPYIQNFLAHQNELSGLGNAVRIAVAEVEAGCCSCAFCSIANSSAPRRASVSPAPTSN